MQYRTLGRSNIHVSELGLGTMVFGWRASADEASQIIDRALERGINLIDTSNSYGRGRSEEIIGEAMKRNRQRHTIILCTKLHVGRNHHAGTKTTRNDIFSQCDDSLRRLKTDYIDVYQIHGPLQEFLAEEVYRALSDLVTSGKVRFLGSSNFSPAQLRTLHAGASASGLHSYVSEQAPYNLLDRSIERETLSVATELGLGIIVWSPLAEGILSGKYRRGEPLPENSRYAKVGKPGLYRARLTNEVYDCVDALKNIALRNGTSISAFCLAWLLAQPAITTILVGPVTLDQLEDNLSAQYATLTAETSRLVDTLVAPRSVLSPYSQTG
jgi:aryl-alcohol dehydrogenase-like predicted oxidoreductase